MWSQCKSTTGTCHLGSDQEWSNLALLLHVFVSMFLELWGLDSGLTDPEKGGGWGNIPLKCSWNEFGSILTDPEKGGGWGNVPLKCSWNEFGSILTDPEEHGVYSFNWDHAAHISPRKPSCWKFDEIYQITHSRGKA